MKSPLNTCLKDRYTLIEQSDLNTLIEQSQYSSEEQCSKLIDKGPHFNSLPWAPQFLWAALLLK